MNTQLKSAPLGGGGTLFFDPVMHVYSDDLPEDRRCRWYTSVTTLVGDYCIPFDTATMAERTARKRGVPVQDIIKEWTTTATRLATWVREFTQRKSR